MSALQQHVDPSDPARSEHEGGTGVPPTSVPGLPVPTDRVDPDGAGIGGNDGGGDGAGDPAFDFFRQDAIRQGFVGPDGFAQYLKQYGILSPSKQYRITEKEITGLDLDTGDLDDRTSEWDALEQSLLGG